MKIGTLACRALAVAGSALLYPAWAVGQERPQQENASWSVKTNLLYGAAKSINLGAEFRLGEKTSLEIPFSWNPFTFSENRKWKHILVQPEFRYWTKKSLAGHFFGLHAHYAYFNVGNLPEPASQYLRDHRFEGWLAGAGLSYGYRWNFGRRWGLEATVGAGYAYMSYARFLSCRECTTKIADESIHYFGPTRAGITLIYNIGGGKKRAVPASNIPIPLVVAKEEPAAAFAPYTPRYAVSYVVPEKECVKNRSESGKAYLDFASGRSEIVTSFQKNASELQKIHTLIEAVKKDPNATITAITITGYASPEDSYASNLALSEKRATALKNHIRSIHGFPESLFTVEGRGEDWATLDSLVSRSNMADKYLVLEIIRGTDIFDGREKKLMDLSGGNPYREMSANLFPQLRRTEYQLHYTVAPFTAEKGIEVFERKPSSLSLYEMYLIANTLTPGSERFNEILETAARMYPRDDAANLNAAAAALGRGDTAAAEVYLSKVKEHSAAYRNNLGVLYGLRGEFEKATLLFDNARDAGSVEAIVNAVETKKAR